MRVSPVAEKERMREGRRCLAWTAQRTEQIANMCRSEGRPHIRGTHVLSEQGLANCSPAPAPKLTAGKRLLKRPSGRAQRQRPSRTAAKPLLLLPFLPCSAPHNFPLPPLQHSSFAPESSRGGEEDGGGDVRGRRVLRRAQQADIAAHHRRRRRRLRRRRAVHPRRRRATPGIRAPCAAAAWRVDAGATGLHVVPPRRQLRQRRRQHGVAAAAAAREQGHRRVHPAVHARRRAPQEEGQEQGSRRRQGAHGRGSHEEARLIIVVSGEVKKIKSKKKHN